MFIISTKQYSIRFDKTTRTAFNNNKHQVMIWEKELYLQGNMKSP